MTGDHEDIIYIHPYIIVIGGFGAVHLNHQPRGHQLDPPPTMYWNQMSMVVIYIKP